MKAIVIRIFTVCLFTLLIAACSNEPIAPNSIFSDSPPQPYPPQPIFVTAGKLKRPYVILGPVEYTLENGTSLFSDNEDRQEEVVEHLKAQAIARYGSQVDAIINLSFTESIEQGYFSPKYIMARGLAVKFRSVSRTSHSKPKKKYRSKSSSKQTWRKAKPAGKPSYKAVPEIMEELPEEEPEIELTPTEILK